MFSVKNMWIFSFLWNHSKTFKNLRFNICSHSDLLSFCIFFCVVISSFPFVSLCLYLSIFPVSLISDTILLHDYQMSSHNSLFPFLVYQNLTILLTGQHLSIPQRADNCRSDAIVVLYFRQPLMADSPNSLFMSS